MLLSLRGGFHLWPLAQRGRVPIGASGHGQLDLVQDGAITKSDLDEPYWKIITVSPRIHEHSIFVQFSGLVLDGLWANAKLNPR